VEDAHLHDLRAMSLTHAKAQGLNATALAGHTSEAMTARYLRSKEVPEVSGPDLSKIASRRS
jgi:integrase